MLTRFKKNKRLEILAVALEFSLFFQFNDKFAIKFALTNDSVQQESLRL